MTHEQQRPIERALREYRELSSQERKAIAALGLTISESRVLACLRVARHLLAQDRTLDWARREQTWHRWRDETIRALEEALRYRENEPLVLAVGVLVALYPMLGLGAWLMAYKTLEDVARVAGRRGLDIKRERISRPPRLRDLIRRTSLWVGPAGEVIGGEAPGDDRREALARQGYRETGGVALTHHTPEAVMRLVGAVMPVVWHSEGEVTLIAPAP
ncbi:MAG TPA: hypothetical protein ENI95_00555 [Chloroflexi bacterium]|nr:hypothetical protein [Chloroflexota bacterium]